MQIVGGIVALACLILGYRPKLYCGCVLFELGENWGGLSLGRFSFVSTKSTEYTRQHELGHSIQNAQWGPLFPFVIGIPSAIRYWYREWVINCSKRPRPLNLLPYDSIWFEGQATQYGKDFYNKYCKESR